MNGGVVANGVIVTPGTDGDVSVFATDETDFIPGSAGPAGAAGTAGSPGAVVWASSFNTAPSGNSFVPVVGLNLTPSGTRTGTEVAAGLTCSSLNLTLVRSGTVSGSIGVGIWVNGAYSGLPNISGDGTATFGVYQNISPGNLITMEYSNGTGSAITGNFFTTVVCNP